MTTSDNTGQILAELLERIERLEQQYAGPLTIIDLIERSEHHNRANREEIDR